MIKNIPLAESPREKARTQGIEHLSNVELLALILRTGNKDESVLQVSERVLNEAGGMSSFSNLSYSQLTSIKGIKQAKAIEMLAVIEIAKRMRERDVKECSLLSPHDIYLRMKNKLMYLKQEHFLVLCLNTKNRVIMEKTIFIGTIDMSVVTPREVFKEAIAVSAAKIVLVHNHPSGDASASEEDVALTRVFIELGEMLAIEVIDHIIVGWNEFYSLKASKLFKES